MSRSTRPALVTVLLSGAAVAGYFAYRLFVAGPEDALREDVAGDAAPASDIALPDALPEVVLADLDGAPTSIASWPDRPLLVNFWATWCAPCLREIPLLKSFQAEHPDVQVVGIAVDRLPPVVTFAEEMAFNYPILVGQTDAMEAAAALGVQVLALPITVLTDSAGAVLGIHTGEIHAEHLENYSAVLTDLAAGRIDRAAARARVAATM